MKRLEFENETLAIRLSIGGVVFKSGLTWTSDALLIEEFSGQVWRLPFLDPSQGRSAEQEPAAGGLLQIKITSAPAGT